MLSLAMMCCLFGPIGECPRCDDGLAKGLHYKHARPDSIRNGMPQTCYDPRYGCYPGNNRHMHRAPAFHGTFYRTPSNYRHVFDYPWHAQPHEPQPLIPERAMLHAVAEPMPIGEEFQPLP